MKTFWSIILLGSLAIAQQFEPPPKSVKLIVIADSLYVYKDTDEGSEILQSFGKGDEIFTKDDPYGPNSELGKDNHHWLEVKTSKGDGWMQKRFLLCDHVWQKLSNIDEETLADAEKLSEWLGNFDKDRFSVEIVSVSPDKQSVVANIGCDACKEWSLPHFIIGKGLVAQIDAYEWLGSLWSEDSHWLAGMPQIPPDGYFDQPLSLYNAETGETTFIEYCQYISEVEFYDGHLIWLGFDGDIGKVMPWDYLYYDIDFSKFKIFPALWAYNLTTKEKVKLLEAIKSSISKADDYHEQARLKPAKACPVSLRESNLFKKHNGSNALLWFDTLE